ncbi:hypothetical protein BLA24064_02422 [Burkholderia latens]|uniref:Uncharacterized protein n=1 Tax=Burkholderia latens TaxID=488446 RepID=A0A6P2KFA7_9BURK|nr:hypothetical protein BLA24064_02422 [Burkholderia latens]
MFGRCAIGWIICNPKLMAAARPAWLQTRYDQ